MLACQVKHNLKIGQHDAVATLGREMHLRSDRPDVDRTHLCIFPEAVAGDGTRHLRHDLAHRRIVGTQNGRAIKRHAVQKVDKGFFQVTEIMPIGFHVVRVNVRNHGHHWQQVQKRGI